MGIKELLVDSIKTKRILDYFLFYGLRLFLYALIFFTFGLSLLIFAKLYEDSPNILTLVLNTILNTEIIFLRVLTVVAILWMIINLIILFIKLLIPREEKRKKEFKDMLQSMIKKQNGNRRKKNR